MCGPLFIKAALGSELCPSPCLLSIFTNWAWPIGWLTDTEAEEEWLLEDRWDLDEWWWWWWWLPCECEESCLTVLCDECSRCFSRLDRGLWRLLLLTLLSDETLIFIFSSSWLAELFSDEEGWRRFSDPLFNDRSDTCCWEYFTLIDVDGSDDKCLCFRCWSLSTSSCLRFCSKSAACFSRYFSRVSFWGARVAKACPCLLACAPWSVRNASALWEIGAGKLKAELCRFDRPLSDIDSPSNGKVVDASEYTPPPMSHMLSINELSWLRVVWKVSSKDWLSSFGFLAAWLA